MQIFSLGRYLMQSIAIDLGTVNTIIAIKGRGIVLREPSALAVSAEDNRIVAVGSEALAMLGRTPGGINVVYPMKDGVIADFNAAEFMIRGMVKMINKGPKLFSPSLKMVVGIPSGSTEVEIRAVRDSSEHAGGRDIYMIYEPMAAAIGIGLDVEAPEGSMVIDIGGGTTEIAVIALGGIVCNKSIRIPGGGFTADIQAYMRHQHNIKIGEKTAEDIKIAVGAALPDIDNPPPDYIVRGPNIMTALPIEIPVSYQEIAYCLDKSLSKVEAALLNVLEQTPPELYADIVNKGIYMTGGGSLLRGLDKRLADKININFILAEDPLHAVARGTAVALKNVEKFPFLIR